MKAAAFPLLTSTGATRLVQLATKTATIGSETRADAAWWLRQCNVEQVLQPKRRGAVAVALTVVGRSDDLPPGHVLVHCAGLPGAVHVAAADLAAHHGMLRGVSSSAALDVEASAVAVSRAASRWVRGVGGASFLREVLIAVDDDALTTAGLARIIEGGRTFRDELRLGFPFHSGGGDHTTLQWFDTSDDAVRRFGDFAHGEKRLFARGVAACVGVRPCEALDGLPALYWQPFGRAGCAIAPALHALPSVAVGAAPLSANGPAADALTRLPEELTRYLDVGTAAGVDEHKWLSQGLFSATPGAPLRESSSHAVVGVDVNDRGHLDLFVRGPHPAGPVKKASHGLVALSDLTIYNDVTG
jgi:hypothetical protein